MGRSYRILIVDDEPGIRTAISRWFQTKGFLVDCAEDGQEAVDKCRENDYDIVTMDLEMPCMGGLAAIPAIRAFRPTLPILVLTGYAKSEETARAAGADGILIKPLRLTDLEAHVMAVLVGA